MQIHSYLELDAREVQFVHELANGAAPTRAAKTAGFSVGHTRALLEKPCIQAMLQALATNATAALAMGLYTCSRSFSSCGRCLVDPVTFPLKIFSAPASVSASIWESRFCSSVETRAYPNITDI